MKYWFGIWVCNFLVVLMMIPYSLAAQNCEGICSPLAYEGFNYVDGAVLSGAGQGSGWGTSWSVQNGDVVQPGYGVQLGSLGYGDLVTEGNSGGGGRAYLSSGRVFDLSATGPFGGYLGDDELIGRNEDMDLFVSALIMKGANNGEQVFADLHAETVAWLNGALNVGVGYYGTDSDSSGVRYWSLRVDNGVYRTDVPVVAGSAAFFVLHLDYDSTNVTRVHLYMNPTGLGDSLVSVPSRTVEMSRTFGFASLRWYGGAFAGNGGIDEIRVAESYRCAAPDGTIAANSPPVALMTVDTTVGNVPFAVQFDGSVSYDLNGLIDSYVWDFQDFVPDSSIAPLYTFDHPGYYEVRLTVTDSCGLSSSVNSFVEVRDSSGEIPCLVTARMIQRPSCGDSNGVIQVYAGINGTYELVLPDGSVRGPDMVNDVFTGLAPGRYMVRSTGTSAVCTDSLEIMVAVDSSTCAGWSQEDCELEFGIHLSRIAYWEFERPFKDYFKYTGGFFSYHYVPAPPWWNTNVMDEIPIDSNGYPIELPYPTSLGLQRARISLSAEGHMPLGDYVILYDGTGVVQVGGAMFLTDTTAGRLEARVVGEGNIYLDILDSQLGDHVRNIRVVRVEHEANFEAEPFYEVFLDHMSNFGTIRFMNWNMTNSSTQLSWSDRKMPTDCSQGDFDGVAYEYMIALANRLQRDVWVCVPHLADEGYMRGMARLFRDSLDPNLKVYLEYSNEVWNWSFGQAHWVSQQYPSHYPYPRAYANKSRELFRIWDAEFGGDRERLKRVIASQRGNVWVGEQILAEIPPEEYDYYSISWYFGYGDGCGGQLQSLGANATGQDVLDCTRSLFQNFGGASMRFDRDNASMYGKPIIHYEGGQHMTSNPLIESFQQGTYDAQIHPDMYNLYQEVIDTMRALGSEMAITFTLAGPRESRYGSWGHLEHIDQSLDSIDAPKYRAVLDNIVPPCDSVLDVLPVEVLSFEGLCREDGIGLHWVTGRESQSDYVEVERSVDGLAYEGIAQVELSGYSEEELGYTYFDEGAGGGYYRLKFIDVDGTFQYSSVVEQVCLGNEGRLLVYPNPAHEVLHVHLGIDEAESGTGLLELVDVMGKVVYQESIVLEVGENSFVVRLEAEALSGGYYSLNIRSASGGRYVKKVVLY